MPTTTKSTVGHCGERGIQPAIAERRQSHGTGLGTFRRVAERAISWLHGFRRLRIRWERRDGVHEAFLGLAAAWITHRHVRRLWHGLPVELSCPGETCPGEALVDEVGLSSDVAHVSADRFDEVVAVGEDDAGGGAATGSSSNVINPKTLSPGQPT